MQCVLTVSVVLAACVNLQWQDTVAMYMSSHRHDCMSEVQ